MLNAIREGRLEPQTISRLRALSRRVVYYDGIEPSDLYVPTLSYPSPSLFLILATSFPTRREAYRCNENRLGALEGGSHTYRAIDVPAWNRREQRQYTIHEIAYSLDRLQAANCIELKVRIFHCFEMLTFLM